MSVPEDTRRRPRAVRIEAEPPVGFKERPLASEPPRDYSRMPKESIVEITTDRLMADCNVQMPVPFCPALSRMTSTIGLPVSGSILRKICAVMSIR